MRFGNSLDGVGGYGPPPRLGLRKGRGRTFGGKDKETGFREFCNGILGLRGQGCLSSLGSLNLGRPFWTSGSPRNAHHLRALYTPPSHIDPRTRHLWVHLTLADAPLKRETLIRRLSGRHAAPSLGEPRRGQGRRAPWTRLEALEGDLSRAGGGAAAGSLEVEGGGSRCGREEGSWQPRFL